METKTRHVRKEAGQDEEDPDSGTVQYSAATHIPISIYCLLFLSYLLFGGRMGVRGVA